jgi:hypothetical protein
MTITLNNGTIIRPIMIVIDNLGSDKIEVVRVEPHNAELRALLKEKGYLLPNENWAKIPTSDITAITF